MRPSCCTSPMRTSTRRSASMRPSPDWIAVRRSPAHIPISGSASTRRSPTPNARRALRFISTTRPCVSTTTTPSRSDCSTACTRSNAASACMRLATVFCERFSMADCASWKRRSKGCSSGAPSCGKSLAEPPRRSASIVRNNAATGARNGSRMRCVSSRPTANAIASDAAAVPIAASGGLPSSKAAADEALASVTAAPASSDLETPRSRKSSGPSCSSVVATGPWIGPHAART